MVWSKIAPKSVCAAIVFLILSYAANASEWRVSQTSGDVFIKQQNATVMLLQKGMRLKAGSTVVTDRGGRAILARGDQTMIVSPGAVVTLPAEQGGVTKVLQVVGEVEFHVDSKRHPHFSVETPYFAAVVKGTRFTVNVHRRTASVGVSGGLVEVTNLKSGDRANVAPGQRGSIGSRKGISIKGLGEIQKVKPGVPRAPLVAPATAKQVLAALLGNSAAKARTDRATSANGTGNPAGSGTEGRRGGGDLPPQGWGSRDGDGGDDGDGDDDGGDDDD